MSRNSRRIRDAVLDARAAEIRQGAMNRCKAEALKLGIGAAFYKGLANGLKPDDALATARLTVGALREGD